MKSDHPPSRSRPIIGTAVLRLEDDRLLRGFGAFVDDLPEPAGTLHLVFLQSPHAHARIVRIDTAAARASDGVSDVVIGEDLAGIVALLKPDPAQPGFQPIGRPVLASDRVRFAGELVAVVLATDRYRAEDAVELIEVEYEMLPAIINIDAACAPGAEPLHADTVDNVLFRSGFKSAGFEEALAGADLVLDEEFHSGRLAAVPIEPRGCLAVYDPGKDALQLWTSTQIPHIVRTAIAELLDWDETKLHIIAPDVGGGFGVKATLYPEEVIAAALARRYRCAVKWIGDRREDLISSTQARDVRYRLAMGFRRDGVLVAVKATIHCNIGAYPSFPFGCSAEAGGAAIFLPGPYRLGHYAFETSAVTTNTCPTGVYRGVAAPASFFATEALMDRAAHKLGLDPAELRLRNILNADDLPYVNAVGIKYDSGSFKQGLQHAMEMIDYAEFRRRQAETLSADGKFRGIGIACVTEHTGQGASRYRQRGLARIPGYDSALVRVEPNGKAIAAISQATQGQGHLTAYAQIVAEQIGLSVEDVTVIEGDTALCPYGTGTFASRGAIVAGGATLRAAEKVADKIRRIAADLLEADAADVELSDGQARIKGVPQYAVSIRDVAAVAYSLDSRALGPDESFGLEATDFYDPPAVSITDATHIVQVAVDPVTGLYAIERYVVAHDCGRVINPLLVAGQLHGGIVQGLGSVLCENFRYDMEGQPITTTLMDYLLPTIADTPDIEVWHQENWASTVGGFKGVGEGGTIGAVPAIANALRDALKQVLPSFNRLPITPSDIMKALTSPRRE